jgi:hypothetical protein
VFERPHPPAGVVKPPGEFGQFAFVAIVPALDGETDPVAGWDHDAGRPDLHVDLIHLARGEWLGSVVRVIGAVPLSLPRVEGPM